MKYDITVEIQDPKLGMDAEGFVSRQGSIFIRWDGGSINLAHKVPVHLTKAAALRYMLRKTGISLRRTRINA